MRLLALVLLTGCAQPYLRVFSYPDMVIVKAWPPELVDQFCTPEASTWDDGTPRPKHANVGACVEKRPVIFIKDPEAFTHELAHVHGVKDPAARGFNWRDK